MRFACLLLALCSVLPACAQEAADKPWETWVPATYPIPDPNAFELYDQALLLIQQIGEPEQGADLAAVSVLLEKHRETFRLLQAAIAGDCRLPGVNSFSQTLPYLAHFRSAARLLSARARVMRENRLYLEAALDSIDGLHIASDVGSQPIIISFLVMVAMEHMCVESLDETVPYLDFDQTRLALNHLRRAVAGRPGIAATFAGELEFSRFAIRDQIVAGIPEEVLAMEPALRQLPDTWTPAGTWHELTRIYGIAAERARQPKWSEWQAIEVSDPLAKTVAPMFQRVWDRAAESKAKLDLAILALAAHGNWAESGAPPDDLTELLVSGWLPELPVDWVTGDDYRIGEGEKGPVVYSPGIDGEDQGGGAGDFSAAIREPLAGG